MLSFEDESTPALGLQLLHSTPSGITSPAKAPPAPDSSPRLPSGQTGAQLPASRTRVRAEDKRVINAKTNMNQLVPFKYKWT